MSEQRIPLPFHQAAPIALEDGQLRRNLANVTSSIRSKRAAVTGELPDWEALRDAGEAIKDHTLKNLGHYLQRFEERFTEAGGTVHWARRTGGQRNRSFAREGDRGDERGEGQIDDDR